MSTPSELEVESRQRPPGRVTFEEFLDWCDEDTRAEWVDGVVEVMSPVGGPHQVILQFLIQILGYWIEVHELGQIRTDFVMRLSGRVRSGRAPDLIFVANDQLGRLHRTYLNGPADLVVEIISPDSIERDRQAKLAEYERAGVPEYWILDPDERDAAFYQLGADGRFQLAHAGRSGLYHSRALPGFWLDLEWLWEAPSPRAVAALRRLGLVPS